MKSPTAVAQGVIRRERAKSVEERMFFGLLLLFYGVITCCSGAAVVISNDYSELLGTLLAVLGWALNLGGFLVICAGAWSRQDSGA